MADINLNIKIKSVNVEKAEERLLKVLPNDDVDENGDPKYATTKAWVEEICRRHIYNQIKNGHQQLQREADDILETQDDYLS